MCALLVAAAMGMGCASSSQAERGSSSAENSKSNETEKEELPDPDESEDDQKKASEDGESETNSGTDDQEESAEEKTAANEEKTTGETSGDETTSDNTDKESDTDNETKKNETTDEKAANEETKKDESTNEKDKGTAGKADENGSTNPNETAASEVEQEISEAVSVANDGDLDRAASSLKEHTDHSEVGFLAHYNLGRIAERRGNSREAAKAYIKALDKNPKFSPALTNLVRLYIRNDRLEDAEEYVAKYRNEYSDVLGHRVAELEVYLAREQYEDVRRKAKNVLREDEQNVGAMIALAKANYATGRYELTKWIADKASEIAPKESVLPYLVGLVALNKEEYEKAEKKMKRALELNPNFAEAHNNLGYVYQTKGNFTAAVKQYRKAVEDFPGYNQAKLNLGVGLKQVGKAKKADGKPDVAKEKFEEAEKQFQSVIESEADNPDAYYNLGMLYLDSPVPGMKKIPRLEKGIEFLNKYKKKAAGKDEDMSEVNEYIKSTRSKIENIKERRKLMRKNQQSAGSGGGGGSS